MRFLIDKYGFMPNGNRTFYLGNTQPPFYYKMVEEIFDKTGDKGWLKESYDALVKEYDYWQTNRMAPNGLNVYGPHKGYTKEYTEEKYDGLTGNVGNADYNAPKMMGWTAGVYMYFCN